MMTPVSQTSPRVLIVIPTLNEGRHIAGLLRQVLSNTQGLNIRVVVADGGSTDATRDLVKQVAEKDPRVALLHNPDRIQSAGINRAVEAFGDHADLLVRIDAHSAYPAEYCKTIVEEATAMGTESVVVAMRTVGIACFQRAVAAAQNSWLGTGGSPHRVSARAGYVDHGHHAMMRLDAFRAIGGYDGTFSHNEDAEYDIRLRANGGKIWLTEKVRPVYFPRDTFAKLFKQYRSYGKGRARTHRKHRLAPKVRQLLPALIAPACAAGLVAAALVAFGAAPFWLLAVVPALLWLFGCLFYGAGLAFVQKEPCVVLSGPAAILMHFAWSLGFWTGILGERGR